MGKEYQKYIPKEGEFLPVLVSPVTGEEMDMDMFLHDACNLFMLALAEHIEKQGIPYQFMVIKNQDALVHCGLCVTAANNKDTYFVDARGITSDTHTFFNEWIFHYKEWYEGKPFEGEKIFLLSPEEAKENLNKLLYAPDEERDVLFETDLINDAECIIYMKEEYYMFPKDVKEHILKS